MALEDLVEKTTKMFPKPTTLAQIRWLCQRAATDLAPFEIRLYADHSARYGSSFPEDEKPFFEQRVENLAGAIEEGTVSANFTFITESQFDPVEPYTGLRFDTMPYKSYEDIPEPRRKLMEKFCEAIDKYLNSTE